MHTALQMAMSAIKASGSDDTSYSAGFLHCNTPNTASAIFLVYIIYSMNTEAYTIYNGRDG